MDNLLDDTLTEEIWKTNIDKIRPSHDTEESEEIISRKLRILLEDKIRKQIENIDQFGIFFSGGLDSSIIAAVCKKAKANFTCYTAGFQDGNFKIPDDIIAAKEVASHLKLSDEEFRHKIYDIRETEELIVKTIKILGDNANVVNVGVGSVIMASHAISDKEKYFFSGLGSEEIFAGYDRHKRNPTNLECISGLYNMYERDLIRDQAISKALNIKFLTPFMDYQLIRYALTIPIGMKINSQGSKIILRNAFSKELGKHSLRQKKAAQYGSSFDKALAKLTSIHRFKLKKEYINAILKKHI